MLLIDCPYQNCSGVFAAGNKLKTCVTCGREVWVCPACGSINRVFIVYCRACKHVHEIRPVWAQEGYDDRRSHLPVAWSNGTLVRSWVYRLPTQQVDCGPLPVFGQMGPAPVIVGDAVFFFDVRLRTLNSHFLFRQEALLWSKPIFSHIPFASSLVHFGPYLYFITPTHNNLQRVALDSGEREICSIVTQDGAQIDLPGELLEYSPPTLLSNPSRIPGNENRWLSILTTQGILFVDLASSSRGDITSLNAKWVAHDFRGREWGKPVVSGRYLVAVAQNAPDVLIVDLAALPEIVYVRMLTPHGYETSCFSPCLAESSDGTKSGVVYWLTNRNAQGRSELIRFQPPTTFNESIVVPAPGLWQQDRCRSQPLIDQDGRIYAPGDGLFTIFQNTGDLIQHVTLPMNSHVDFSRSMFVRQTGEMLVCAEQGGVRPINPFSSNIFGELSPYVQAPIFHPVTRPILGRDRLIIQCEEIVACFS